MEIFKRFKERGKLIMKTNTKQGILILVIFIGLPILANIVVNILENIITMQMIMKCVYLALGLSIIYIFKEVR